MWSYCFLALLMINTDGVQAVSEQVVTQNLTDYLFSSYRASLIPICDVSENVTLNMDLALRQVMELNEREQILSVNVWVRLSWNDCRLRWDPASFNNLTYMLMTHDDVWIPDITLYDSAAEEVMMPGREDYSAYISSSGGVTYNFPTVIKCVCRVDVRHFPFDTQRCKLKFGSWSHHGFELDVVNRNPTGDLDNYVPNSEWLIESLPVVRSVLWYNCCPEPYPDITYYIVMRRRPDFYLLTMIFPCMLTSVVAAACFLLPVESGEKVSLDVTVLLSMAVFLLLVSESMPPSSDNFPIIGTYFACSMALVSMSCFMTVMILNVFYRGTNGRRVPRWAKVIFFQYIGKVLCTRRNKISAESDVYDHLCKIPNSRMKQKYQVEEEAERKHNHISQDHSHHDNKPDEDEKTQKTDNDVEGGVPDTSSHGRNGISSTPMGLLAPLPIRDPLLSHVMAQTKYLNDVSTYVKTKGDEDACNSEWRDLANVMDRLFLLLYMLVTLITTLSLLLQAV